jgi:serine/threonine protein kinase
MSLATESGPTSVPGGQQAAWIGDVVDGRYRVNGWLGSGGMGDVFEVVHTALGKHFALKALRAELSRDAAMVERFQREAHAMAKLMSDHVVSIVDSGTMPNGAPYFVMERLVGQDLRRLLASQGPLPPARASQLGVDACRGLAVVHAAGLVHRDLKPENLFVSLGDDGREVCKILDFGVAKSARDNATRPGTLVGTTRYMAPEQVGLELPVGPYTDIYALAVILYECLCGVVPFDGDTVERVLFKIMTEQERSLVERCADVPSGLASAIHAALSKQPQQRPPSALAFAESLIPHTAPHKPRFVSGGFIDVVQPLLERPDAGDTTPPLTAGVTAPNARGRAVQSGPISRSWAAPMAAALLAGSAASLLTWLVSRSSSTADPRNETTPRADEPAALQASALSGPALMPSASAAPESTLPNRFHSTSAATPDDRDGGPRVTTPSSRRARPIPSAHAPGAAEVAPPPAAFDPRNPYGP